jgi:hypothetical protein
VRAKRVLARPRGWALLVAVALTALTAPAVALLSAAPAGADGTSFTMIVDQQSNTALTLLVSNFNKTCTNQLQLTITAGPANTPITPNSTVNQDLNDVVVTLPTGTPSPLSIVGNCLDASDNQIQGTATPAFATVNMTKQVQGPDPANATFTVHFDCAFSSIVSASSAKGSAGSSGSVHANVGGQLTGDLQYGAAGGTSPFYFIEPELAAFAPATCTLTETNTGGAQSTSISPNPVTIADPIVYSATVTNTFVAPAAALVVAPQFTG